MSIRLQMMKNHLIVPLFALLLTAYSNAGVVARYSFDSGYSDDSGNGRHGSLTDTGTVGNSGIHSDDYRFGGGCVNLSQDRDYVGIPSRAFVSGEPWSVSFWARKTVATKQWSMVVGDRTNTNHFIGLGVGAGGQLTGFPVLTGVRWRGTSKSATTQADFSAAEVESTDWHHYVVTASADGKIRAYLDGALRGEYSGMSTDFTINTIGEAYSSTGYDMDGLIDEVWIFDEAIDSSQVSSLYLSNSQSAGGAYAGFHHRYDGDFSDSSGNGVSGTPSGGAVISTDASGIASGLGALSLDGADGSFVSLDKPGSYTSSEPWTTAFWAKRGEIGANRGMVMGTSGSSNDSIWLNDSYSGLRFRSSSGNVIDFSVPKDMQWHHHVLVADGTGNLLQYRDGLFIQQLVGDTAFAVDTIGKGQPTTTEHLNFKGLLDEVRIVPVALSQSQVQAMYDDEKPTTNVPDSGVSRVRVLLVGGQSNADGRAAVSGLPIDLQAPQNDVDFYYKTEGKDAALTTLRPGLSETSQFGPEILLGRRYADVYSSEPGTRIAIIKYANGGTNLYSQWKGGGDATTVGDGPEYLVFQQTVASGMAALQAAYPTAAMSLEAMLWMQGESDSNNATYASAYQTNLTTFIGDLRATYGAGLPFVIGRLSDGQAGVNAAGRTVVQQAQDAVAAADPLTGIVNTNQFALKSDQLHFDAAGQQSLGSAFADEAMYCAWVSGNFSGADLSTGLTEPGADFDGDGRSNSHEYLAGTDPCSQNSFFRASMRSDDGDLGVISYDSSSARLYEVQRYLEADQSWIVELPPERGTGTLVSRSLQLSGNRGFYRVRAIMP